MRKRIFYIIHSKCWYICAFVLTFYVTGCQPKLVTFSPDVAGEASTAIIPVNVPDEINHEVYRDLKNSRAVHTFYENREFKTLWFEHNQLTEKGKSMMEMILSARRFGLLPQDYHKHELLQDVSLSDPVRIIRFEVLLTDGFLKMARDLRFGRMSSPVPPQSDSLTVAALADFLSSHNVKTVLEAQEPRFIRYSSLKGALNNILDTIGVADQSLLLQGITNDSINSHRMVQIIEINLERLRLETASLAGTYAWVNIPAYMFSVVEDDEVVLESRVVVGKRGNETPEFSSKIECFTVFPYWYVPRSITVKEYLPVLKKDTTFLTRNNFDVLDRSGKIQNPNTIDWTKLTPNNFPYALRQREGKENSLGVLKFVFDNPYAVFLHDTNAKRLFNNRVRAFSHGCVRLEKAYEFAHYLIAGRSKVSKETLDKYLVTQKKATINLTPAVPIHIRYYTCEVKDGKLMMYDDVYRKDQKVISRLYNDKGDVMY